MNAIQTLLTDHLDIWTAADTEKKSGRGRSSGNAASVYGIKKLRELILELAVRGKLVPQDPNDEPASVLLERIADEKAQLIQEGLIKKEKLLPEINEDEKTFTLPNGWEWSRLQDVSSYVQRGKGPRYADFGKVQVVSQKSIQWAGFDLSQTRYVDDVSLDSYQPERFLRKGDLLWNSTGTGTAGRINVVPEVDANSLVADSHVTIIRPLMTSSSFLSCYVSAPGIQQRIEPEHENSLVSGTTNQVELNLSAVVQLVVPVPPLAEQRRIVAKVDELMALCDQLEQQQTHSLAAHQALAETLLGTLACVESQQEFSAAWARIASHFDTLFTTEVSIDQLKQTILQLAVMGKLVPQDPNDEPASVLLEKIAKEQKRLIEEGKLKKQKPLPVIGVEETLFDLPEGWAWARLQDVIDVRDGTHDSPKDAIGEDTYPLVTSKNFINGEIDFDGARRISAEDHVEISKRSLVEKYDILFSMIGGNLGNQVMVLDDRQFSVKNVALFKYYNKDMTSPYFVKKFMEHLALDLQGEASGGAQPFVSLGFLRSLVFGLPPCEEQHRIVAKVDELMALCDALKARLDDAQAIQFHLADAIVEQAVC